MLINKRLNIFREVEIIDMGNNNNRNNGQRQQGQQQPPQPKPVVIEEQPNQNNAEAGLGKGLVLENADLDAPDDLGVLKAAPAPIPEGAVGEVDNDFRHDINNPDNKTPGDETTGPTGDAVTTNTQQGEYVPPVQENTAPEPAVVTEPAIKEEVVTPPGLVVPREEEDDEASLIEDPASVLISEMITADGTAVTTIMLRRLEKHMKFIRGTLAFRDKQELFEEQVTWIDTVGNSLNLDYPQYVLVTKAILAEMLKDVELFRDGGAYRFLQGIKGKCPANAIEGYEAYVTFLTRVAANWSTRHRLRTSVDIAFPVSRLPTAKGKENLTKFFNTLVK